MHSDCHGFCPQVHWTCDKNLAMTRLFYLRGCSRGFLGNLGVCVSRISCKNAASGRLDSYREPLPDAINPVGKGFPTARYRIERHSLL